MRKELEKLWQYYLIEVPLTRNDTEKEIISKYSEKDNNLRSKLNNEQNKLLEEYDDAISKTNSISERYAFVKGVCFAIRLIFEAFCND